MATMKFLNAAGKYSDPLAYECVIGYIMQDYKTPSKIIGGLSVDLENPAKSMRDVAVLHRKDYGVRLRHFIVSFMPNEIQSLHFLKKVADQLCFAIGCTNQVVYAAHEDTDTLHLHYVFSSVSYITGHKYHGSKEDHYQLKKMIASILKSNGIGVCYEVKYRPNLNNPHE